MVRIICEKQSSKNWLARFDGGSPRGFGGKGTSPLEAVNRLLENCDQGFRLEQFKPDLSSIGLDRVELVLKQPESNWTEPKQIRFEKERRPEPSHCLYSALTISLIAAGATTMTASIMVIIWIQRIWSTKFEVSALPSS